ncbi:MAG TPA: glutamate--tRNA ligase family protein, partial [Planctomycetota bacterium]
MTVRVRFAPSPTGDLHIGGVRTALYNFLFARHEKGTFVLRVEDTDQKRNREESLATIKEGLSWCGLAWDEGPHYQSLRLDRYRECAKQLEAAGRAYWQEDPDKGKALRFRIDRGPCRWPDVIHGESVMDTSADPDLVIIKSDGFPTYNFAVVVDDHDMKITHVLRADEHYPNTPKQISLYRALGWEPPLFGHMPLIFAPDGSKLSKRETEKYRAMGLPVSVGECRKLGYLPEAVVNFLALLGWSPGNNVELMTLEEMI